MNERQLRKIVKKALLESIYNGYDFRKMQNDYSTARRENPQDPYFADDEDPEDGYDITSGGQVTSDGPMGNGYWEDHYPTSLTDFWGQIINQSAHASGLDRQIAGNLASRIELSFKSDEEMEEFIGVLEQGKFQEAADFINRHGAEAVETAKNPDNWLADAGADFEMEVTPEMLQAFYEGFKKVYNEGQTNNLFTENKKAKNGKAVKINEKQLTKLIQESIKKVLKENGTDTTSCKEEIDLFIQKLWTRYSPTTIAEALSMTLNDVQAEADDYVNNVLQYPTR